jgi:hypothetical protein
MISKPGIAEIEYKYPSKDQYLYIIKIPRADAKSATFRISHKREGESEGKQNISKEEKPNDKNSPDWQFWGVIIAALIGGIALIIATIIGKANRERGIDENKSEA